MKRLLCLFAACTVLAALIGCNKEPENQTLDLNTEPDAAEKIATGQDTTYKDAMPKDDK